MDIYETLGVRRIVNGSGTLTSLGGNTLAPEVRRAMAQASQSFVFMEELQKKAGEEIARIAGAEAAYVVSGAAAGVVMSIAACISRGDTVLASGLPGVGGARCEVLVQEPHRSVYTSLIGFAGGKARFVGNPETVTEEELEAAMGDGTAAVLHIDFDPMKGVLPLETVIELGHRHGVPVVVDAAAELPPVENLARYVSLGADLVVFSGGKDIGAPSDTGFVCGRKTLVDACAAVGPYNSATVDGSRTYFLGRPMKTSKEDIAALVVALRSYRRRSQANERRCRRITNSLLDGLSKVRGIQASEVMPGPEDTIRPLTVPRVRVTMEPRKAPAEDLLRALERGDPSIRLYSIGDALYVNPQCLRETDVPIIVARLAEVLAHRGRVAPSTRGCAR